MESVVFELTEKPKSYYTLKDTDIPLVGNNQINITLSSTVLIDGKSTNIAVVDGESDIFVDKHREKDPLKVRPRQIKAVGLSFSVPASDTLVLKYLEHSYLTNQNPLTPSKKPRFERVDRDQIAENRSASDRALTEAKTFCYSEVNEERVKAYAVAKGLFTLEQVKTFGMRVISSTVASLINEENAAKYNEDFSSDFLYRQFEMIKAREAGLFIVDEREKAIIWADSKGVICNFAGRDAIEVMATYTMSKEGQKAYQYIKDGVGGETVKTPKDLKEITLEEKVKKAIRLEVFESGSKGFKFENVNIGGDEVKVVEHFTKNPKKIDKLDAAILVKQS